MVYTPEEKMKMDDALQAFAEYTVASTEFDVAYADKTGYVRLIIDEGADQVFFLLTDFDDLMDMFCMEIVAEEVNKQLKQDSMLENKNIDYDAIRLRLQGYIDRLQKAYQTQAGKVADAHIRKRAMSPLLP